MKKIKVREARRLIVVVVKMYRRANIKDISKGENNYLVTD